MESAPACDRYEYLKLLDEADKKYRANLQAYDDYKPGDPVTKTEDASGLDPAEIAKKWVRHASICLITRRSWRS